MHVLEIFHNAQTELAYAKYGGKYSCTQEVKHGAEDLVLWKRDSFWMKIDIQAINLAHQCIQLGTGNARQEVASVSLHPLA
jgi:hypothetical protein